MYIYIYIYVYIYIYSLHVLLHAMVYAMVLLLAMIWHPLLPYRLGPPRSNPHFAPSQPALCHWFKAQSYKTRYRRPILICGRDCLMTEISKDCVTL